MGQSTSFKEQVERNLPKVEARPEFDDDRLWLTFYLFGLPDSLRRVAEALVARGWTNVEGGEGDALYPKVQVEKSVKAIVAVVEETEKLCTPLGVEIDLIDADTSPDQQSQFEALYRSRA